MVKADITVTTLWNCGCKAQLQINLYARWLVKFESIALNLYSWNIFTTCVHIDYMDELLKLQYASLPHLWCTLRWWNCLPEDEPLCLQLCITKGHKLLQSSPKTIDYSNRILPPACIKLVKDHLRLNGFISIIDAEIMETEWCNSNNALPFIW